MALTAGARLMPLASGSRLGPYEVLAPLEAMAVDVSTSKDGVLQAGVPRKLFQGNPVLLTTPRNSWDVTPDGQRFLINSVGTTTAVPPITVVVNWMAQGQTTR